MRVIQGVILGIVFGNNVALAEPPFDPAIDVQLFELSPGAQSFLSVNDASLSKQSQFSVDFLLTFLTEPFVIYDYDEVTGERQGVRTKVVDSLFAGQLVAGYGLTENLQLGLSLPLIFSLSGQGLDPQSGNMATGGLQATGLGDLGVEAKGRIYDQDGMAAAWYAGVTLPTSYGAGGNAFLGDDLPALRGGGAVHWDAGDFRVGANAGVVFRKPRTLYAEEIGQQLSFGLGVAYSVTSRFSVIGETFGRTGFTAFNPVSEVAGGVRVQATKSVNILAGGGAGVSQGIGAPSRRFVLAVNYAPDMGDNDGDGVSNMNDLCPTEKEDRDGFEDSDGCPDNDNDGDKRPDFEDKCPLEKEDIDGFEDDDGCPEPDNDQDGILDARDRCPTFAEDGREPGPTDGCPADKQDLDGDGISDLVDQCPDDEEDVDGFEDWDGCPDFDNDRDGVLDEDDQCPSCSEDMDGFADGDGCPDFDNDNDGVADGEDRCPDQAEVLNGNKDGDGCPDRGAPLAELQGNAMRLNFDIRFTSKNKLRSKASVRLLAKIMMKHPDVSMWRIVVVPDRARNKDKARIKGKAQADALRDELVASGMSAEKFLTFGAFASKKTLAIVASEREEPNPEEFVCPAGSRVLGREPN